MVQNLAKIIIRQEVMGRTNRLLSVLKTTRPTFLLLMRIRYRGNVSTEPLPSNDRGIFTDPLPSNNKGIFTESLPNNDRGDTHTHTHTHTATCSQMPSLFFQNKVK
jgi:hypothetical protein